MQLGHRGSNAAEQINKQSGRFYFIAVLRGPFIVGSDGRELLRKHQVPPGKIGPHDRKLLRSPLRFLPDEAAAAALQRLLTQIKPKPIRRLPIPSSRRPAPPPRPPSPAIGASASGPATAPRHLPPRWGATRSPPRGCCPTCSAPTSCRSTSPSSPTTVRARSSLPSGVPSESQPIG